jgi:hypothetical protein
MVKRTFKKQTKRGKKTLRKPIYRRKNKTFRKNSKKGFRKITHKKGGMRFFDIEKAKKEKLKLKEEIELIEKEIKAIDVIIVKHENNQKSLTKFHEHENENRSNYDSNDYYRSYYSIQAKINEKLEELEILKSKLNVLNYNLQFLKKNSWTKYSKMKINQDQEQEQEQEQEPVTNLEPVEKVLEEVNNDEVDVGPVEIGNPDKLDETFENPLFKGNEEEE